MAKSISLKEIHLSNIGVRSEFGAKLGQAMAVNPLCSLHVMDLSYNFLEDKGLVPITQVMAKVPKGMHHLNLRYYFV